MRINRQIKGREEEN